MITPTTPTPPCWRPPRRANAPFFILPIARCTSSRPSGRRPALGKAFAVAVTVQANTPREVRWDIPSLGAPSHGGCANSGGYMTQIAVDLLAVLFGGLLITSFVVAVCIPFLAVYFALGN
jgi:hypothetical protein